MAAFEAKYGPDKTKGCSVIMIICGIVIGVVWLMGSLFAPNYHIIVITPRVFVFLMKFFEFSIGLFEVRTSAHGLIGNALKNNVIGRGQHKMAKRIVQATDGQSLGTFANWVCSFDAAFYWQLNLPCDRVNTIYITSTILMMAYIFSAILLVVSAMALLIFWFVNRNLKTRQAVFLALIFAAMLAMLGIVQYLTILGPSSSFGANWFSDVFITQVDRPLFSMGPGFGVACGAMMWVAILPFWALCAIPKSFCYDFYDEGARASYDETEALIDRLNRAAREL
eukprot:GHVO01046223.1.p1 GENE.GHVO01046223.1~~GHVO01046223.1.p1  ORF type:complete len:291 (+),score=21.03 GHVO01046223.1:33-875(+)